MGKRRKEERGGGRVCLSRCLGSIAIPDSRVGMEDMTLFENRGLEGPRGTGQRKESGLAAFPSSTRPWTQTPKGRDGRGTWPSEESLLFAPTSLAS